MFHKLHVLGMICGTELVDQAVKLGKGVNELRFWWS